MKYQSNVVINCIMDFRKCVVDGNKRTGLRFLFCEIGTRASCGGEKGRTVYVIGADLVRTNPTVDWEKCLELDGR